MTSNCCSVENGDCGHDCVAGLEWKEEAGGGGVHVDMLPPDTRRTVMFRLGSLPAQQTVPELGAEGYKSAI